MPLLHDQVLTLNEEAVYRDLVRSWKKNKEYESKSAMSILIEIMTQELLAENGLWHNREAILERSAKEIYNHQKVVVPNLSDMEAMKLNIQITGKLDEELMRRRLIYRDRNK